VPHTSDDLMADVFLALCEKVNTPFSLGMSLLYRYDQKALADVDFDPRVYRDLSLADLKRLEGDYLVASFLSKYKGLKTGYDLEAEALKKFRASEESCRAANERLIAFRESRFTPFGACRDLGSVFHIAQRKIAKVLGPHKLPRYNDFGWGPGATSDLRRAEAYLDTKIKQAPFTVSPDALELARWVIQTDLHWSAAVLGVAPGDITLPYTLLDKAFVLTDESEVCFAVKNAKTHRTIAKEPRLNSFLQKGYGRRFRRSLKRVGIDLDDQTPNQIGASRAWLTGEATLDLRAASDSNATELVYELFPPDWAIALDSLRTHHARLPDGSVIELQKFSSMGNGFTFELETVIFWALASAVTDLSGGGEVLVYGDDIIVPGAAAAKLIEVLAFCGFEVNTKKSFVGGVFHESCGKHYFRGVDVTPCYQKEPIAEGETPTETVRCANRLIRWGLRRVRNFRVDTRVVSAWRRLRRTGDLLDTYLPIGVEGDDGWVLPWDKLPPHSFKGHHTIECMVVRHVSITVPSDEDALLAHALRFWTGRRAPLVGGVHLAVAPETRGQLDCRNDELVVLKTTKRTVNPSRSYCSVTM